MYWMVFLAELRPEWCWSRLKPQGHGPPVNCEDVGFQWPRSLLPRISRYQLPAGSCPAPTLHNHWSSPRKCPGLRCEGPWSTLDFNRRWQWVQITATKKRHPFNYHWNKRLQWDQSVAFSHSTFIWDAFPYHSMQWHLPGSGERCRNSSSNFIPHKIQIRFEPLILKLGFKTPTLQFTTWRRIPLRSDLLKSLRCNGGNPGSP